VPDNLRYFSNDKTCIQTEYYSGVCWSSYFPDIFLSLWQSRNA